MKYLSIDLEATGLEENDYIIEFAAVPFDVEQNKIFEQDSFHVYVKCPTYEELLPRLSDWVKENNEDLIKRASKEGLEQLEFQDKFEAYLKSKPMKKLFGTDKIILFGKSMNAIDLPFMNRDLGWDFLRTHFNHRTMDLSTIVYHLIDRKVIPRECESGSFLMNFLGLGDVEHTALEDAVNTAKMYLLLMKKIQEKA